MGSVLRRDAGQIHDVVKGRCRGQRSISAASIALQARSAECLCDGCRTVFDQQAALQNDGDEFRKAPRVDFTAGQVVYAGSQFIEGIVEPTVTAARRFSFGKEYLHRRRLPPNGAQKVKTDDVSGTLPNTIERRLPVKPRHDRFLDIAGTAMTFQCLANESGQPLVYPIFLIATARREKSASAALAAD